MGEKDKVGVGAREDPMGVREYDPSVGEKLRVCVLANVVPMGVSVTETEPPVGEKLRVWVAGCVVPMGE